MQPQIIAIANQKGGVGKTTTCANLGIGLAAAGKAPLLVDCDAQGSLSISLGYAQPDKLPFTLSTAMERILLDEPIAYREGILQHEEGIDLIPANIELSGLEVSLVNAMSRETVLKRILQADELEKYEYIIIDCLPSLGILMINALAASDYVIAPVQAQKFALDGISLFLNAFKMVKANLNPCLQLSGILLTMYDNTNMAKAVHETLLEQFPDLLFSTTISRSVEATNSTYEQKSLVTRKSSKLGKQYLDLAEEFLNRGVRK